MSANQTGAMIGPNPTATVARALASRATPGGLTKRLQRVMAFNDAAFAKIKRAEHNEKRLFSRLGLLPVRNRLERAWAASCEGEDDDLDSCVAFQNRHDMRGGEIFFVPDRRYYSQILSRIRPNDVVLDAGAGDLRFSLALAKRASKVYAVEINPKVIGPALGVIGYDLPNNVIPICADVFRWPVPADVTTVVCIMIHRSHDFPVDWGCCRVVYADFYKGVQVRKAV
jgi:hypothetical protein